VLRLGYGGNLCLCFFLGRLVFTLASFCYVFSRVDDSAFWALSITGETVFVVVRLYVAVAMALMGIVVPLSVIITVVMGAFVLYSMVTGALRRIRNRRTVVGFSAVVLVALCVMGAGDGGGGNRRGCLRGGGGAQVRVLS
jgi:hypothetical protein